MAGGADGGITVDEEDEGDTAAAAGGAVFEDGDARYFAEGGEKGEEIGVC